MILNGEQVSLQALAVMQGYLAERSNVCAKVIDAEGRVIGINRRGLELLGVQSQDVCGKVWTEFWEGAAAEKARNAVAAAFDGQASAYTAEFFGTGQRSVWEIEVFPLEQRDDGISSVLALSVDITEHATQEGDMDRTDLLSSLNETLHTMANIATVSQSSARMLPRARDEKIIAEIAAELAQAARKAQDAISDLRAALPGSGGARPGS